jgi:glycosyltransferase involved in cell wall biosynthesis
MRLPGSTRCDVVIPCYNARPYIRETIQSVLAQTHPPAAIIVVDDGSTDGSGDVAASCGSAVRVVRQPNAGECAARNTGIEQAQSEWIAFLDADDVWRPTKLQRQFEAVAAQPDALCVHTDYYVFGGVRPAAPTPRRPPNGAYAVEALVMDPLVNPSTSMIRAGLAERFPVGVRQGGDMLFFASLALRPDMTFAYVDEPLVGYRLHPGQVTQDRDAWVTHFRNRLGWLEAMAPRLGERRADDLRRRLRAQIVEWIDLARWTRQWARYESLRDYAAALEWPEGRPPVLGERLWPAMCYGVKDWVDRALGRDAAAARRVRSREHAGS